jgi:AcrR family transcriptional regulator
MARRKVAADQTRLRILQSARTLLLAPDFREFTMESVAKAAGVSRLTLYHQFESKAGLLEALYDYIAHKGHLGSGLADVFQHGNVAVDQLQRFIEVFARFWTSDRDVIRRLHGLGAIDAEIGESLRARNERRRNGLRVLVEHHARMNYQYTPLQIPVMLDILHMLTSFETFDALAIGGRSLDEVIKIIRRMALEALGMWPRPVSPYTAPPIKVAPTRQRRSRKKSR